MSEKRDNSGILFKNDRKQQDNHADYQGTCTINGVEYYMNAWLKDGAKGKFMSFSFKPKKLPADYGKQQGFEDKLADDTRAKGPSFGGDEIPFSPEVR